MSECNVPTACVQCTRRVRIPMVLVKHPGGIHKETECYKELTEGMDFIRDFIRDRDFIRGRDFIRAS